MWLKKLFLFIVFLLVAGLFSSYFYNYLPGEAKELLLHGTLEGLPDVDDSVSNSIVQFETNMRFSHNDLTYSFVSECGEEKIGKMKEAFEIIERRTELISFKETKKEDSDILISCSNERITKDGHVFITGEGGPSKFLNLSLYPLIIQGEIMLYEDLYKSRRDVRCEEPIVEVHELMHVFGYDHVDNKSSILYPYFSCEQELGQDFVDDIIDLYSIEPKAEIYFENVSAVKSGPYLNFNVSIPNHGLILAGDVSLRVYAEGKEQKFFELNDIKPGVITSFNIENLHLPSRNTEEIEFRLISDTREYDLNNNVVKLVLE
jgi:hypothetical protein